MRPKTGYLLFCEQQRAAAEELAAGDPRRVFREFGRMWRELSQAEQDVFRLRACAVAEREQQEQAEAPAEQEPEEPEKDRADPPGSPARDRSPQPTTAAPPSPG